MLKNIETKIINSDNKIKKELKDEIDKHKKNFKEFIES
jgi:formiminotetrahydrofolate cyclodeaminase